MNKINLYKFKTYLNKSISNKKNNIISNNSNIFINLINKSYSPELFKKINDLSYNERLYEKEQKEKNKFNFKWNIFFKNIEFPFLILLFSCFTLYLWNTVPFSVLFKHLTISEYTIQKYYLHTIFLSSLSNPILIDFLIYFPLSLFSILILSNKLKSNHFFIFYLFNSIISSLILIILEKKYFNNSNNKMLPTANGNSTFSGIIGLSFFATSNQYFKLFLLFPTLYQIYCIIYKNKRNGEIYPLLFSTINGILFFRFLKINKKLIE